MRSDRKVEGSLFFEIIDSFVYCAGMLLQSFTYKFCCIEKICSKEHLIMLLLCLLPNSYVAILSFFRRAFLSYKNPVKISRCKFVICFPGRGGQTEVTPDQTSFERTHVPGVLELHGLEKASSALLSGQWSGTCLIRGHFVLGRSDQRSLWSGTVWSEAVSSAH